MLGDKRNNNKSTNRGFELKMKKIYKDKKRPNYSSKTKQLKLSSRVKQKPMNNKFRQII